MQRFPRWASQWIAVLGLLLALPLAGGCGGCGRSGNSTTTNGGTGNQPTVANDPHRVGTVTPAGGSFEKQGVRVVFSAGAVPGPAPVVIEVSDKSQPSPDKNEFIASPIYRLEAGERGSELFTADVEVTLPYDPASLPAGFDEANLRPMWWTGRVYRPVERFTVDRQRHEVKFLTRHFSDHANGGDKAKAVPPPNWQRKHPELPVEIEVVETYLKDVTPEYLDQLESHLAFAYEKITSGQPYNYLAPGRGKGGKLVVTVTDLEPKDGMPVLGAASTPTRLRIKYDLPEDKLKHTVVHEFFHCVQYTHFERTLQMKRNLSFSDGCNENFSWLDEASAEWIVNELGLSGVNHARADFCFEELTYHPRWGKLLEGGTIRPGSEAHPYASAIFIKYLAGQYGDALVPELLDAAYGPELYTNPQLLMDDVIRRVAPKAGHVGDNLYSCYARFVLEHIYTKDEFGNWNQDRWKLGPRHELNLPGARGPDDPRRPPEIKLSRDKEFKEAISGRTCQVPVVFTLSRADTSQDEQLELTLSTYGQPSHKPSVWLYAFTKIGGSSLVFPKVSTGGRVTIDLDAKVDEQVIVVPVSLESQTMDLKGKLTPRKKQSFEGSWVGKSNRKGLGSFDYDARISRSGDDWQVHCGDMTSLVYSNGDRGCKVEVKGNHLKATLVDDTISEGRKTTFTFEVDLFGNQLNGTEKCEDEFKDGTDKRTAWETSFMLIRKP